MKSMNRSVVKREKSASPVRSTGPIPLRAPSCAPPPLKKITDGVKVQPGRNMKAQNSTPPTSRQPRRPIVPSRVAPAPKPKIEDLQSLLREKKVIIEEKEALIKKGEENIQELIRKIEELQQELNKKIKLIEEGQEKLVHMELENRSLFNSLVDCRGKIRVAVRVRPLTAEEKDTQTTSILSFPGHNKITCTFPPMSNNINEYGFQHVFGPNISQHRLFENIEEFVLSVLNGYNVAVIAFGQTGSGKTFTMRGAEESNEGIIPRAGRCLFKNREKLRDLGWEFSITASYVEVYNDEIYDLLGKERKRLELKQVHSLSSDESLTRVTISDLQTIDNILTKSEKNRTVGATKCNVSSSRSHAIFEIKIKGTNNILGTTTDSVLHLVDLAGSERVKESGVEGQQLKETGHINKSLTVFCRCIASLRSQEKHIPYRDSKLTNLLSKSLGAGSSKTLVIINLNPSTSQAHETKRSLDFANEMAQTKIGAASKNEL